ncbi:MAG: homogentisate 1,2-dioxygenase [Reyranellaceae bacterium]
MARNWIPVSRVEGVASRQAHVRLPADTYEREISKEGFFGPSAQFHHPHKPTDWIDFEGPIRPRAFDLNKLVKAQGSPWAAQDVLKNGAVHMRIWRLDAPQPELARNSDGDDLLFIHEGAGHLFCDYGHMEYRDGDYIVIPRGTMWRLEPTASTMVLMIEATNDHYTLPDKGIAGRHAIFDPAILDTPSLDDAFKAQQGEKRWRVAVKRRDQLSTITYPFNPLDTTGWHGDLSVVRVNWRDIRPIMSHRAHLPPSVHTTFLSGRFVVCTFVPRPLESDPEALRLPFFHNNDDFEEVLFYHKGSFFSRDNIHPGMMTVHPSGFTHGPHPKAFHAATKGGRTETDEVAVMLDTRDALDIAGMPAGVEFEGYVHSWRPPQTKQAAE